MCLAIANDLRVYLDEHHYWEAWGKNLNEYLGDIYNHQSRYALILISQEYVSRVYINLERRRALDRALLSKQEYILPVRLDDSWLEGLPRATAYFDLRKTPVDRIGEMLVHKVKGQQGKVIIPEDFEGPKVVPLELAAAPEILKPGPLSDQLLDFVTAGIVAEHPDWEERIPEDKDSWLFYNKGMFDPISVMIRLVYIIGSDIAPARRYHQIMKGEADLKVAPRNSGSRPRKPSMPSCLFDLP